MKTLQTLHFQSVPALPFFTSISGAEPEIIAAIETVFGAWRIEMPSGESRSCHWNIERDLEYDGDWTAQERDGVALHHADLAVLVAQIEYAALQNLVAYLEADFFGLHGALLSRNRRAILLVGPKEAGKSTLSCALWQAGWRLHCDDFSLLDAAHHVHPTARRVSLRSGSRKLLGEALWAEILAAPATLPTGAGCLFHPFEVRGEAVERSRNGHQLSAIFFLQRRGASVAAAQTAQLPEAVGALGLLPYSTFMMAPGETQTSVEANWSAGLPRLAALVGRVPLYDLGRGDLDAMIAAIERVAIERATLP